FLFFFSSRRRHTRFSRDWSSDVCSSDLIQGARQIKQRMPDGVFVFLLPPSFEELEKRLHKRGTDSSEAIGRRLKIALEEVAAIVDYDYWILNRDLEEACEQLVAIIRAERARVSRTDLST